MHVFTGSYMCSRRLSCIVQYVDYYKPITGHKSGLFKHQGICKGSERDNTPTSTAKVYIIMLTLLALSWRWELAYTISYSLTSASNAVHV